jgi:hypothetical protein
MFGHLDSLNDFESHLIHLIQTGQIDYRSELLNQLIASHQDEEGDIDQVFLQLQEVE